MQTAITPSTREFLTWLAARPRTYAEAMDAWRTSCPRLSAWEDALGDDLIQVERGSRLSECAVTLTTRGRAVLDGQTWQAETGPGGTIA
jgi:hypothetical protein